MPTRKTYLVTDFFEISNAHPFPRDTVMSAARLHMRWHGVPTIASTVVTGYRYKLDEPNFNTVDSSVHETGYNTGVGSDHVNSGRKVFTLQAIGQSGWRGEATRWFQMNFAPDSWFAGPDPNDATAGWQTLVDGNGKRYWFLDFGADRWDVAFHGVSGSMLSADSAYQLPPMRAERKTFLEAYNQRLWLRQEGDTVHLNSWVIIPSGGFDKDSPYAVRSNMTLFGDSLSQYPVLTPGKPNGSASRSRTPRGRPRGPARRRPTRWSTRPQRSTRDSSTATRGSTPPVRPTPWSGPRTATEQWTSGSITSPAARWAWRTAWTRTGAHPWTGRCAPRC
jgi:hypothetical protein